MRNAIIVAACLESICVDRTSTMSSYEWLREFVCFATVATLSGACARGRASVRVFFAVDPFSGLAKDGGQSFHAFAKPILPVWAKAYESADSI